MNIGDITKRYNFTPAPPLGTLFELDLLTALKTKTCPYCGNKLYEMRNRPFFYCKSKKHIQRFIVSKDKMFN